MAPLSEVTTLPADLGEIINEKKTGQVGAVEGIGESEGSEAAGSVLSDHGKSRPKLRRCKAMAAIILKTDTAKQASTRKSSTSS